MKFIFLAISFVLIGIIGSPTEAGEKTICMSSEDMEASLVDWYGESPKLKQKDGSVVWASANGETWTRINYLRDGQSCVMAFGTKWQTDGVKTGLLAQNQAERG